jgi:amino acid transporter
MVAFGFIGIESVALTAFEARSSKSLRFPSQCITYVTLFLYFLCLFGQCLNVSWTNDHLPFIFSAIGDSFTDTKDLKEPASSSLTSLALWDWRKKSLAGFLNAALIFSVLSAGNTSLYIASRTLYGIARDVPTNSWIGQRFHSLSIVVHKTGVPARALVFSALSLIWLPFISLKGGYAIQCVSSVQAFRLDHHADYGLRLSRYLPV